jgi:hypothetical protein
MPGEFRKRSAAWTCTRRRAGALLPLLAVEQLPHRIWEPAAGKGAIVKVLRDRGRGYEGPPTLHWLRFDGAAS